MRITRVLWARRVIVATATLGCMAGGLAVIATAQPRYEATAKVELLIVAPDPVTGFFVTSKNVDAYVGAQIQTIRDFQVGVRVARDLGWLDSPDLQSVYAARPPGEEKDFEHWVSARVTAGISGSLLEGSNILEIKYRAVSPEIAQLVVENIRNAYIETVTAGKRQAAEASANQYAAQADTTKARLAALEGAKSAVEQKTGMILQYNGKDIDSAQLSALARMPNEAPAQRIQEASKSGLRLAEIDSVLASAEKTLGPNNPSLIGMRQQRSLLASQVALERQAASVYAGDISRSRARLTDSNISSQMAKVISQRPDLTRLRLMQDQIDLQRARYNKTAQSAVQQRQLASLGDGGVMPVGLAEGSDKPAFPNKPLILLGSGGLGLTMGVLMALLLELLGRRVRGERDLQLVLQGATLTVLPKLRLAGAAKPKRRLPGLGWMARRKTAKA
jgi:uncharacterized protein involved in exopolysaccharide biosynthesis